MNRPCDFCGLIEAEVTLTRTGAAGPKRLRLCERCTDLHQFALAVFGLESNLERTPCFVCCGPSEGEGTSEDPHGRFLGRFAICRRCAATVDAERLRTSTLWTPGVLELPPPEERLKAGPPGSDPSGNGKRGT